MRRRGGRVHPSGAGPAGLGRSPEWAALALALLSSAAVCAHCGEGAWPSQSRLPRVQIPRALLQLGSPPQASPAKVGVLGGSQQLTYLKC